MDKIATNILEVISKSILVLMTLVVSWVVFSRFVLRETPAWGHEVALLCMVWFAFLSIAIGVKEDVHLGITIYDRFLPPKAKTILDCLKRILLFCFAWFMLVEGINMSQVAMGNTMPGIRIPAAILYIPVPVAGVVIIYFSLSDFFKKVCRLISNAKGGEVE